MKSLFENYLEEPNEWHSHSCSDLMNMTVYDLSIHLRHNRLNKCMFFEAGRKTLPLQLCGVTGSYFTEI